ncbi:hypothetical protein P3T20_001206 [Paraburkholderia sp. GAS206C]
MNPAYASRTNSRKGGRPPVHGKAHTGRDDSDTTGFMFGFGLTLL